MEKAAAKWTEKAAEQGHPLALYNMGWSYANGRGVPWDEKKAVKWYERAAKRGDPTAANNLGAMYHNAQTIQKYPVNVLIWFKIAAPIGKDNLIRDQRARALTERNLELKTFTEEMFLGDAEKANRLAAKWLKKHGK